MNPNNAPLSLAAITREQLSKNMLNNNLAHCFEFKYFSISREGQYWVAWYCPEEPEKKTETKKVKKK